MMLRWSAPQDAGWYMNLQTSNEAWIGVAMFSFGYIKMDFVSHVILFSHLMLFMKPTIYRAETAKTSVWAPAFNFLFQMNNVGLNLIQIHIVYSWVGYLYISAKLPHDSNTSLLNNFKEGIFIFDESSNELQFQNDASKRIQTKLNYD